MTGGGGGERERTAARMRARLRSGSEGAEARIERGLGAPALFAIAAGAVGSSLYFALGIVAQDALALTPVAFAAAGLFFLLTMLSYLEGSSLHTERGGASMFARYAFNELWSFVAGWAILLDFMIVMALGSLAVSGYLGVFWHVPSQGGFELVVAATVLAWVVWANIRGQTVERYRRVLWVVLVTALLSAGIIVVGLFQFQDYDALVDSVDLGSTPTWGELTLGAIVAGVALTGIESASGLAGELRVGRRGLRRVGAVAAVGVLVLYVGMALVAVLALPVEHGASALSTEFIEAPIVGVVSQLDPGWLAETMRYAIGAVGVVVLLQAVNGQMLGIGRLAYSLGTNRQIPSLAARLDATRGTPYVAISIAAAIAFALSCSADAEWLAGIFAFGATLAFTLAHLSVVVLRYREPDRKRAFRVPLNVRVGGGDLPLPSALGAILGAASWVTVVVLHEGARYVGGGWLLGGLAMYVIYRKAQGKSLTQRFTIPEAALSAARDVQFGSILVPIFGERLDDDIVGTAGRLAAEQADEGEGVMLEAVWVFQIPMSLPIDARVPDERIAAARRALARAKEVGEEYEDVEVSTAMVRGRSVGAAIVAEAKRRGVEAIVLAAEAPTRIRGGAMLGGRGIGSDRFAGDFTRYVIEKAPCKVILTAPPADDAHETAEHRVVSEPT
ncbi:MAG TPA: amino acid permease [Thermoleophilaceae bacterium]|nr:amino acid permease [Thermoleophilaceae bacterium]